MADIMASRGPPPAPPPHALSFADDSATDYFSEVDTALNTPTSWTTEHVPTPQLNSRWSLSSSWSSTFSRPTSIHNNNHNTNKRSSEFFMPRRSMSPKNMHDRVHHRTSLPPNSISTPTPTPGGGKLFSKLAAFSHNNNTTTTTTRIIQEEERKKKRQKQQPSHSHNNYNNHDHHHNNTSHHRTDNHNINQPKQQQKQQQQYRMHPHESIRVQRLLGMVYQFQQTSLSSSPPKNNNDNHSYIEEHSYDQALSAFCTQLQAYLESWADLKQDKRHVVRQTKTSILRSQRTSSIRSKRQKRNVADRLSYRQNYYHQKQNNQLSDSDDGDDDDYDNDDDDDDDNYDNDGDNELEPANTQRKLDTSHGPLLARINELEEALATSECDKNQVKQKLNTVQAKLAVTQQQPVMSSQQQKCSDDTQRSSTNVDNVDELKNATLSSSSNNNSIEQQQLIEENNTIKEAIEQQEQSYSEVCTMLTQTQTNITELELKLQTANDLLAKKQDISCDCKQTIISERDMKIQDLETTLQQLLTERQNWEQQAAEKYFHEKETFKVQISREVRELAGTLAEQESQMDVLEKRRQQDALTINRIEALKRAAEQKCQKRLNDWEAEEKKLRMTVATLEAKIVKLEQDTLVLYSKNLKLAHQLGQWAP